MTICGEYPELPAVSLGSVAEIEWLDRRRSVVASRRMTSSSLDMPPQVFKRFTAAFPLVLHDSAWNNVASSAPARPTLWVLGPAAFGSFASHDVRCLRWQAALAFAGEDVHYRLWSSDDGAPSGRLPALHLPDGKLFEAADINDWLTERHPNQAFESPAWYSLVESKVYPALATHLFTEPVWSSHTRPLYHPKLKTAPWLSKILHRNVASTHRSAVLSQMSATEMNADPGRLSIAVEDLEDGAAEAFSALEERLTESGGSHGWLLGSEAAQSIDAVVFAHCHVILSLPHTFGHVGTRPKLNALRNALTQHVNLVTWTRRLEKEYFR